MCALSIVRACILSGRLEIFRQFVRIREMWVVPRIFSSQFRIFLTGIFYCIRTLAGLLDITKMLSSLKIANTLRKEKWRTIINERKIGKNQAGGIVKNC